MLQARLLAENRLNHLPHLYHLGYFLVTYPKTDQGCFRSNWKKIFEKSILGLVPCRKTTTWQHLPKNSPWLLFLLNFTEVFFPDINSEAFTFASLKQWVPIMKNLRNFLWEFILIFRWFLNIFPEIFQEISPFHSLNFTNKSGRTIPMA